MTGGRLQQRQPDKRGVGSGSDTTMPLLFTAAGTAKLERFSERKEEVLRDRFVIKGEGQQPTIESISIVLELMRDATAHGQQAPQPTDAETNRPFVRKAPALENDPSSSPGLVREVHGAPPKIHFTKSIIGPQFENRLGENMDFDMTALWIAGWAYRTIEQRQRMMHRVAESSEFNSRFENDDGRLWLSAMREALDKVIEDAGLDARQSLTLRQITTLLDGWNQRGSVLCTRSGEDLLSILEATRYPEKAMILLLLGNDTNDNNLFAYDAGVDSAWIILNMLRYWSIVGREDKIEDPYNQIRMPMDKLNQYIDSG